MSDWCTIESDPGVFTALIESFGVKNAQLTELWSLDDDTLRVLLQSYGKIHGLVFLFKWQQNGGGSSDVNDEGKSGPLVGGDAPEDLFFARQVTTNACATQAILSILLNAKEAGNGDANDNSGVNVGMELGETLSNLKAFTSSFPPDLKGESIGASEEIRNAHNSFAKQEAFMMADEDRKRTAGKDDEVFHFVAYGECPIVIIILEYENAAM
jgi:ubiquitin carboxyl-terminal hydrolase L5